VDLPAHAGGQPSPHLEHAVAIRRANPLLTDDELGRLDRAAALVHENGGNLAE
jgi:hypothetical protein